MKPLDTLMTWRVEQSKGVAMLKTISTDDAELKRLLSTEYNRAIHALRGSSTAPSHTAQASTSSTARSAQPASNPPGLPQAQPAAPVTRVSPSAGASSTPHQAAAPSLPVAPAATRPQSSSLPGQPPAKKRKMLPVDSGDVIDLT